MTENKNICAIANADTKCNFTLFVWASGNQIPRFIGQQVLHKLRHSELTVKLEAHDPDYPNDTTKVKYSLETPTTGVTVSKSGLLTWMSNANKNTTVYVLLQDDCLSSLSQEISLVVAECPCQNSGSCILPTGSTAGSADFECQCLEGTSGSFCEVDTVNSCLTNPCGYGNCIDQVIGYVCDCGNGLDTSCPTTPPAAEISTSQEFPDIATTQDNLHQEDTAAATQQEDDNLSVTSPTMQNVPVTSTSTVQNTAERTTVTTTSAAKVTTAFTSHAEVSGDTTQEIPDITVITRQNVPVTSPSAAHKEDDITATTTISSTASSSKMTTASTSQPEIPDETTPESQGEREDESTVSLVTQTQTIIHESSENPDSQSTPAGTSADQSTVTDFIETFTSESSTTTLRSTQSTSNTPPGVTSVHATTMERTEEIPQSSSTSDSPEQWMPWSQWSECTYDCDYGLRTRQRECTGEPNICQGADSEIELCVLESCIGILQM